VAPTVLTGRLATTTYVYDDQDPTRPPQRAPGTPARVVSAIQSPSYTPEDTALLMALEKYEAGLCKCGWPRSIAWHSEMDGWFDGEAFVCHACSAVADRQVIYSIARDTWPSEKGPLPPFVLGVTTTDS
jgi:hypothetical protein